MCIKIFLFVYALQAVLVDSTLFDQSQSGDLNVQVDLKGIHVIALMKGGKEEYVDYDYAYDYSEMTIKPQNRTTPRPLNVTVEPEVDVDKSNVTTGTTVIVETTTEIPKTSEAAGETLHQTVNPDNSTIKSTVSYFNVTDAPASTLSTTIVTTSTVSTPTTNSTRLTTGCKKGFILNSKGDCELKLQGTGNALLKLVKLSQKLKLRRENKSDSADFN